MNGGARSVRGEARSDACFIRDVSEMVSGLVPGYICRGSVREHAVYIL